ncbi:UNKNOWN [Stylonychia lemnae]|uniref:Secreted protein n=1 Tax=Stylonychia lemnae TaxID=5949 RepID=A0A078AMN9_STYLE|nr:UNKNOWN [Stylonychia lemnae]|eukprot:CDW82647.1 UNKNOWN [Stylonychia lemnae]
MLSKGVLLSAAVLLLITRTNAIKLKSLNQVHDQNATAFPAPGASEPVEEESKPERLQLTEEQIEDYRKECGGFIDRWLEKGLCSEELEKNTEKISENLAQVSDPYDGQQQGLDENESRSGDEGSDNEESESKQFPNNGGVN